MKRFAWLLIPMLAGCAGSPARTEPELDVDIPEQWTAASAQADAQTETAAAWWTEFGDARLNALIDEAVSRNHDLRAAAARVDQVLAQARITGAALYPTLSANLGGSRSKQNFIGLPIPGSEGGVRTSHATSYNATLSTIWEIDLWGRLRKSKSAARADAEAGFADYTAARLSLAGQTARAWFAANEADLQRGLALATVESYETTEQQVRSRFERGLRTSLDLRLARANLASAQATLEVRERAVDATRRRLEVLTGRYPSGRLEASAGLPELDAPVPGGLPSKLLTRRPDLAAAERRLVAADARVAASRRELYPKLSLTGSAGTSSNQLEDLVDSGFSVWSLFGNLMQPIFQGGRLRAQVSLNESRSLEAFENFAAAVLRAFSEVETALVGEASLREEESRLVEAVREARAAEDVAQEQYRAGLVDFVTVLESQRSALTLESRLLSVRRARLDGRVSLHLALGGGFNVETETDAAGDPNEGQSDE